MYGLAAIAESIVTGKTPFFEENPSLLPSNHTN